METKDLPGKHVAIVKPESEYKTTALDIFNDGTRCYIMHFRAMNRPPLSKVFLHAGDLMGEGGAIERAKLHCEKMNYRFCGCYPHIVDLDKQERLRNDELGIGEY